LKDWHVDIGTPVRAGELLADIEAPDLDQQLAQGEADLLTAQANAALARTTARTLEDTVQDQFGCPAGR